MKEVDAERDHATEGWEAGGGEKCVYNSARLDRPGLFLLLLWTLK